MQLISGQLVYSASDLIMAAQCEYATLRVVDAVVGRGPQPPATGDALLAHAAELGHIYESQDVDSLVARYGQGDPGAARGVVVMPRATGEEVVSSAQQTQQVALAGADVIHQAVLFDGRMLGFADFLQKQLLGAGFGYDIADAKLARRAKPQAVLQVAAYAALCEHMGVPLTGRGRLILGDEREVEFDTGRLAAIVGDRRSRLDSLLAAHEAAGLPVEWGDPAISACGRCATCQEQLQEHRDVLLVAGMRVSQRAKLRAIGIETIDALASYTIPENAAQSPIPRRTLENLQHQARMQLLQMGPPAGDTSGPVTFEVIDDARALVGIPPPDDGDIFFDFEGDPLWQDPASGEWGLEYLFGVVELDLDASPHFLPFWAHDRGGEADALRRFLDFVAQRRERHPNMHIYHYADYERAALLRLAARHHTGEDEVDQLLRDGVLVNLYPLVKKSIRVSQDSYSIKKLEPLYLSAEEMRAGEVKDAQASVVEYAKYCALVDRGRLAEAAAKLGEIADYNRDDCISTLRLRDWLMSIAAERRSGWPNPGGPSDGDDGPSGSNSAADEEALAMPLFQYATPGRGQSPTPGQEAVGMVAAAVGYHRREAKPFWWTHFDRLSLPLEEIADRDAMVIDDVIVGEWQPPVGRQKKYRRILRLIGSLPPGAGFKLGHTAYLLYEQPLPFAMPTGNRPDSRGYAKATLVDTTTDSRGRDVLIVEETGKLSDGLHSAVPVVIATPENPEPRSVKTAIDEVAGHVLSMLRAGRPADEALPRPIRELLLRRPPALRGPTGLPSVQDGDFVPAVTQAVRLLEHSALAVQGPPGTGKTYVGSRVIANLVAGGWRVGVVSQGHAAVNHMLDQVVKAGVDPSRVGKKERPPESTWTELTVKEPKKSAPDSAPPTYRQFLDQHPGGCVIGGTAWDFTNSARVDRRQLDLLVIDEAGQFSLATTIAVSVSAERLLLLGDPQQLPQVSQGSHTPAVDQSALGWLSQGLTLPDELGYFLDLSWRMHPEVADEVSRHSYEGRLRANTAITAARAMTDSTGARVAPGILVELVGHTGNDVLSMEEVERVVELAQEALTWTWDDPDEDPKPRAMTHDDVLVVAPYNAQRNELQRRLEAQGLGGVRVGTVDKFQGQEAPVSIVSMTASAPEDVPRGMGFLLSPNRINVAVSRAQWRAVIVRSPHLTDFMPTTFEGMLDLGGFLSLGSGVDRSCET